MADNHYEVDESKYHARKLMEPIRKLRTQLDELQNIFDVMTQMKDGDGTQAAHFAKVTTLFGVASDAMSKAIYDEMNSAIGNLHASLPQLLSRLG